MFRRALAAAAASAVVFAGLAFGASPASAALSGATLTPTVWDGGSSPVATVEWAESTAFGANDFFSLEIEWDWSFAYTAPDSGNATFSVDTFTCPGLTPITFQSAAFAGNTNSSAKCVFINNGPGLQKKVTLQPQTLGNTVTFSGGTVVATFPSGVITASTTPKANYRWTLCSESCTTYAYLYASVPNADGSIPPPPPPVRLDFDGNGGTCSPGYVEGDQDTWGTALTAENCTNGAQQLQGFSTSPTLASGSVFVRPGGPVYFLEANRLYAIWSAVAPSAPQDVVATPGRNSMTVTWKPPASDGGDPILGYQVRGLAGNETSSQSACLVASAVFTCTFSVPATNSTYTYTVLAYNRAGNGKPSDPSAAVSPYDFGSISASRPNVLLGLGGTRVEASGAALGLKGKAVNAEYKVGNAKDWTTQANAATVDAKGKFSWSKKFGLSLNKQNVSLRFTYGTDLVSGTYVLSRGGEAGSLTAPRNIKVENDVNRIKVTWDPPKFDGGEKITGYTMCAKANGSLCRNVGPEGRADFYGLEPGREYTITVAAKTATQTGPEATAKQKVSPVEASVRISRRMGQEIRVRVEATGFKAGAKFRLESAVAVPGEPARAWRWEELRSFTGKGDVDTVYSVEMGSLYDGETIAVRLVTPNGTVYSSLSRH